MQTATQRKLDNFILVVALCPSIAASETIVSAVTLGAATILVGLLSTSVVVLLRRWLDRDTRFIGTVLITASIVAIVELAMQAWFHVARESVGLFLPLLAANVALVHHIDRGTAPKRELLVDVLKLTATMAIALAMLGIAREIVGRGSILHNAQALIGSMAGEITLFRVEMGFLLALLPPGAFIALGCLLAARNSLQRGPMPSNEP